jgi:hypothetical protein
MIEHDIMRRRCENRWLVDSCSGGPQSLKKLLFIAHSLRQQVLGLEKVDDGVWSIYCGNVLLARVDERDYVIWGLRAPRSPLSGGIHGMAALLIVAL